MKIKVIQANEIQKPMKQIVTKYNAEQTVQHFLKEMPGARSQSLHCSNGSMRHALRKTGNDNINETM